MTHELLVELIAGLRAGYGIEDIARQIAGNDAGRAAELRCDFRAQMKEWHGQGRTAFILGLEARELS